MMEGNRMVKIGDDLGFERDGPWGRLCNLKADTMGLRLHAICKRGRCPNPQVTIAFRVRQNSSWLSEAEVRDRETLLRLSQRSYLVTDLSELTVREQYRRFRETAKQIILELELPSEAARMVDFWLSKIIYFANAAAKLAEQKKTDMMTMSIEFDPVGRRPLIASSHMANSATGTLGGSTGDNDGDCAVCLQALSSCNYANDTILTLSCSHKFHFNCVVPWLLGKRKCPLCRSPFVPKK